MLLKILHFPFISFFPYLPKSLKKLVISFKKLVIWKKIRHKNLIHSFVIISITYLVIILNNVFILSNKNIKILFDNRNFILYLYF